MRAIISAAAFLMTACVAVPPGSAPSSQTSLDRRTVERIESGLALAEDLATVGVHDSKAMNRNARVRVRGLDCSPPDDVGVICTYEASRCLQDESDANGDGWCPRTTRFLRTPDLPNQLGTGNGWTADRPDP